MAKRHKFLYSPQVKKALEDASPDVIEAFLGLLEGLQRYPFPGTALLGVLPYRETDLAGAYTATFGDGLLLFQVMVDYPLIKLVEIVWL